MLFFFQKLCHYIFGDFEKEEFKKFFRLGLIFSLIIGTYWTLRPLKDSIFIQFVGALQLPYAKVGSLLALIPLVIGYTKLFTKFDSRRTFEILTFFYGSMLFCFSIIVFFFQSTCQENTTAHSFFFLVLIKTMAYLWYFFVESFGSLVIALFWTFSTSITKPDSAKKGFPLIFTLGQIGGILVPFLIGGLPHNLGHKTDTLSFVCLGCIILFLPPLFRYFLRATPISLLLSFEEKKEEIIKKEQGFFSGLKLIIKQRYLLGVFIICFIYEFIMTIFDFNFKIAASYAYSGTALTNYLCLYGSSVNIIALFFLLVGINNITRYLGIMITLVLIPCILSGAFLGFLKIDNLSFLFSIMVGSKSLNYALNTPAIKQLYIPLSPESRYQAQAWIGTFGSRTAKQMSSLFNMSLAPLQATLGNISGRLFYLMLGSCICFPLLVLWIILGFFIGRIFKNSIKEKNIIC